MTDIDVVIAPFTSEQVRSLNGYQNAGVFHPFTCGNNSEHILVATEGGWICPECDYTQNWAHLFMADWSWKEFIVCDRCQHWDCCGGCNEK